MTGASSSGAHISTRQAAFIGVAAMVGAGIFSLLGAAGEVAGAAVWLSFLIAGGIAALQGYSFAKLGARYPSAGGLLEYVNRAFGDGHISTVVAWLVYMANGIVTAMVAISFGSYASEAFAGGDPAWIKGFAVALLVVMTGVNLAGSTVVARAQSLVVFVVIGILAAFAVVTIANFEPGHLAPSTYPGLQHIVSSVALTFFAFLGFGVVTFTAKDLARPADARIGVGHHLAPLRDPAGQPANREEDREHLRREAQRAIDHAAVEVDVGIELVVDEIGIGQRDRLELLGDLEQPILRAQLGEDRVRG